MQGDLWRSWWVSSDDKTRRKGSCLPNWGPALHHNPDGDSPLPDGKSNNNSHPLGLLPQHHGSGRSGRPRRNYTFGYSPQDLNFIAPWTSLEGEEKRKMTYLNADSAYWVLYVPQTYAAIFPNMNLKRNITLQGRVKNWHTAFPPIYNNIRIGGMCLKYFLFYFGDWEKIPTYKIESKLISSYWQLIGKFYENKVMSV